MCECLREIAFIAKQAAPQLFGKFGHRPPIIDIAGRDSVQPTALVLPKHAQLTASPLPPPISPTPLATIVSIMPSITTPRPVRVVPDALVDGDNLNLRSGPGTHFTVLETYERGTPLQVFGKDLTGAWFVVQTPQGCMGWMYVAYLYLNVEVTDIPDHAPLPEFKRSCE